ncbi:hypothetical protein [Pontibacter roseus]|uniref:hypothetical protein n=1 Tax=Pontibacter roseus TaxID=336989 RepID=UPI00037690C3|nr:hypothetical protein [Pontibacter roseus]
MLDEELKRIWNASTQQERVKLDLALLLQDVDNQLRALDRGIKFRNVLEIGVAVFLLPMFLISAVFIPFLLSKIGSIILMGFCAFLIYKLKKVRAQKPKDVALPLKEYLQEQRLYLQQEMRLLTTVAYWYIAPFVVGMSLFFIGFAEIGAEGLWLKVVGAIVLGIVIYFLNQWELNRRLKPMLEKLNQTISSLQV